MSLFHLSLWKIVSDVHFPCDSLIHPNILFETWTNSYLLVCFYHFFLNHKFLLTTYFCKKIKKKSIKSIEKIKLLKRKKNHEQPHKETKKNEKKEGRIKQQRMRVVYPRTNDVFWHTPETWLPRPCCEEWPAIHAVTATPPCRDHCCSYSDFLKEISIGCTGSENNWDLSVTGTNW